MRTKMEIQLSDKLANNKGKDDAICSARTCGTEEGSSFAGNVLSRIPDRSSNWKRRWLVLVASMYSFCCSAGFPSTLPVLFVEFLDEFRGTKAETSLVQAVCSTTTLLGGLLSGPLVNKFGERKCMMAGALLSGFGLSVSYFANGIPFLVGSIGFISGTGFSLCFVSSNTLAPQYFSDSKKFFVLGFISFGSGIGSILLPIFVQFLVRIYHWRGALLIMSGVTLNMLVSAMVFVPVPKLVVKNQKACNESSRLEGNQNHSSFFFTRLLDVLKNKVFMACNLALWIALPCLNNVVIFFIDYLEYSGIPRTTGIWFLFGMNLGNGLFRLLPASLAQIKKIPILAMVTTITLVSSISTVLFPLASSLTHFVVLVIIFGASLGSMYSVLTITVLHILGEEKYPIGLGISMAGSGLSNVLAGPIGGHLRDITGSYDYSFYSGAGGLSLSFVILLITSIWTSYYPLRQPPDDLIRHGSKEKSTPSLPKPSGRMHIVETTHL